MRTAFLAGAALALSACSTIDAPGPVSTPPPAASPETYRALGTEPFWNIAIGGGRIVYSTPEPRERLDLPASAARAAPGGGRRYVTDRFTMDVSRAGRCSDGMSDFDYPDTVRVTFAGGGRVLDGCGGPVLPPESLADTRWSITGIDGETLPRADNYVLGFAGGRLSGQAGCNQFSGSYTEANNMLTSGAIMATRMACLGPRMTHERRVLQLLRGPVRLSYQDGRTLVLTGNGVTVRLYRQ
jgi:heat shock protein HslJ/uncharacterized membrane protein